MAVGCMITYKIEIPDTLDVSKLAELHVNIARMLKEAGYKVMGLGMDGGMVLDQMGNPKPDTPAKLSDAVGDDGRGGFRLPRADE